MWCAFVHFNRRTFAGEEIEIHFDRDKHHDDKGNHDEELRCKFWYVPADAPFRDGTQDLMRRKLKYRAAGQVPCQAPPIKPAHITRRSS
jgi:hypothetical protein